MKKAFKIASELIISILGCATVGYLLLLLVYALPTGKMVVSARESTSVFQREGAYPEVDSVSGSNLLDNYTDALMILTAVYSGEESLIDRATNAYHAEIAGYNPAQVIVALYSGYDFRTGPVTYRNYGRYWHGYLTVLKPLLCLMSYGTIRSLNTFFLIVTAGALLFLLFKKKMKAYVLPYLITLFLLDPLAIANSMQYSSVYYITSLVSLVLLWKKDKWGNNLEKYMLLFVLTGCFTSYFDLLTYPLVTFGIPATFCFCKSDDSLKENCKAFFCLLISWALGYFCMWGLKWVIGSFLTSDSLISNALSSAAVRSSMTNDAGKAITLAAIFNRNFEHLKSPIGLIALIYGVVMAVAALARRKKAAGQGQKSGGIVFLLIALLPLLWYAGLGNHSYLHHFFTYRELTISVFAILCMLTGYGSRSRDQQMISS